ncbi:MAG: hypothetical protein LBO06_01365 [Bacteroidales bacterium]|jgi:hypothetical protein|nr:hypothetical protein [Bacteroidales bacterium]
MIKKILILLFTFCLVYPVVFRFLPNVAFRTIYGIIGTLILVFSKKQQLVIGNNVLKVVYALLAVLIFAIVSNIVNGTTESQFIYLIYSFILVFLAAYVVTRMIKSVHKRVDFDLISTYIIAAATLQCLLSALMVLIPSFGTFMLETLTKPESAGSVAAGKSFRLLGVGAQFVTLGIINSFALLMIVDKLKDKHSIKTTLLLFLLFIFITIIGSMMSRTTILGVAIGLVLMFVFNRFQIQRYIKPIIFGAFFVALLYFVALPASTKAKFDNYFEFGFEMFYTYDKGGELTTTSTDELREMLLIQPDNWKTWLIGDGYFDDPFRPFFYYKDTDVGYFRLIFYFGIFGCIIYTYYQYQIIWQANLRTNRKHQVFFIFCFILFLILSIKVFVEVISVFMMFLFSEDEIESNDCMQDTGSTQRHRLIKKNYATS